MIRLWSCFHLLLDKANLQNTNSAIREVTSQQERITIMMQAPAPYPSALLRQSAVALPAAVPVRACARCVVMCIRACLRATMQRPEKFAPVAAADGVSGFVSRPLARPLHSRPCSGYAVNAHCGFAAGKAAGDDPGATGFAGERAQRTALRNDGKDGRYVALCCSVVYCVATCRSVLQHVATCCTVLKHVVVWPNTTWRAGCDRQGGRPREEHPAPPQDRRRARSDHRRARRAAA